MDPISVILSALAVAGAKVGSEAVNDAYNGLRSLIMRKFSAAHPRLEERLDDYVDDPGTFALPARRALEESGAGAEEDVVALANEVVQRADGVSPGISAKIAGQVNAAAGTVVIAETIYGGVRISKP